MKNIYSIPGFEDPFSSLIHFVPILLFILFAFKVAKKQNVHLSAKISLSIYVFSVFLMLSMSGVYHLLSIGAGRTVLQRLDHSAIFILIAGTITPIHVLLYKGFMRWGWLSLIWIIALCGIVLKTIFFTYCPEWLGLTLYLGFGWCSIVTLISTWYKHGFKFIQLFFFGAIAYTLGAVMEFLRVPTIIPGVIESHELFHIAVLAGILFHWKFIEKISTRHTS